MTCCTLAMAERKNVTADNYNRVYLVKEQSCERIFSDNTSVNRFAISEALLQCLRLIEANCGEGSQLVAYNTDGIYITKPVMKLKNTKDQDFKPKMIGKAFKTDSVPIYFEKHFWENINLDYYEKEKGKGKIFNGQAGSGKPYRLCGIVSNTKELLVVAITNKATENFKSKLNNFGVNKERANEICHTFDSYFFEFNGRTIDRLKDKVLFIEEFSKVPLATIYVWRP